MPTDPPTALYDLIVARLKATAAFTAIVALRNIIDLSSTDPDPLNEKLSSADLPMAVLLPAEADCNLWSTSSSSEVGVALDLYLTTGSKRVDAVLLPLIWATVKAIHPLKDGAEASVGCPVTIRVIGYSADLRRRRFPGWESVIRIECRLYPSFTLLEA